MSDNKKQGKKLSKKTNKEAREKELKELLDVEGSIGHAIQEDDTGKQKESLEAFEMVDGKSRSEKQKQIDQARDLEDLLGIQEMNPYRTLNEDIFASKLEDMSVSEMTSLAMHVGVTPQQSTRELKRNLIESFNMYARKHNVNVPSPIQPIIDENSPNYKKTVRLFNDI
jgi:hypothetical protein